MVILIANFLSFIMFREYTLTVSDADQDDSPLSESAEQVNNPESSRCKSEIGMRIGKIYYKV
jgi:hypothetical protein